MQSNFEVGNEITIQVVTPLHKVTPQGEGTPYYSCMGICAAVGYGLHIVSCRVFIPWTFRQVFLSRVICAYGDQIFTSAADQNFHYSDCPGSIFQVKSWTGGSQSSSGKLGWARGASASWSPQFTLVCERSSGNQGMNRVPNQLEYSWTGEGIITIQWWMLSQTGSGFQCQWYTPFHDLQSTPPPPPTPAGV